MPRIEARAPLLTVVHDAASEPQRALADSLATACREHVRVNVVPHDEAIGRDLVEAARVLLLDWRLPALLPHLRELLQTRRGNTVVFAGWQAPEPEPTAAVATLRRFAGRVATTVPTLAAHWRPLLMVDVDLIAVHDAARELMTAVERCQGNLDEVAVHLREAQQWLARGDLGGALASAERALILAPDQPGIIADTARILQRSGRAGHAAQLCRSFLVQRPDAEPVQRALRDVLAATGG